MQNGIDDLLVKYNSLNEKYSEEQSNFEKKKETIIKEKDNEIYQITEKCNNDKTNMAETINKLQVEKDELV